MRAISAGFQSIEYYHGGCRCFGLACKVMQVSDFAAATARWRREMYETDQVASSEGGYFRYPFQRFY